VGLQGTFLNIMRAIHGKPTANIIFNVEKLKLFLYDQEEDKDVHSLHFYST